MNDMNTDDYRRTEKNGGGSTVRHGRGLVSYALKALKCAGCLALLILSLPFIYFGLLKLDDIWTKSSQQHMLQKTPLPENTKSIRTISIMSDSGYMNNCELASLRLVESDLTWDEMLEFYSEAPARNADTAFNKRNVYVAMYSTQTQSIHYSAGELTEPFKKEIYATLRPDIYCTDIEFDHCLIVFMYEVKFCLEAL